MRSLVITVVIAAFTLPAAAKDITAEVVLASMNVYRMENGLPPLREDSRLDLAAGDRIRDMEDLEYWAHDSPDGRSPFLWLKPRGYTFRYAGENLASGFETSEMLVSAWMESEGHRANILSPQYDDCGIAIIDGSTKGRVNGKSIVVMFGREGVLSSRAP
jgi:uncharacterized protein YkwD